MTVTESLEDHAAFAARLADAASLAIRAASAALPHHVALPFSGLERRGVQSGNDHASEIPNDTSSLTRAISAFIIAAIKDVFPGHGVVTTSTTHEPSRSQTWVCHPLSGSFPDRFGAPHSTFALALCHDGVPHVAVIADPWGKKRWEALDGRGARRDGRQLSVSNAPSLRGAALSVEGAGISYHDLVTRFEHQGARTVELWSPARAGALVADGHIDALCFGHGDAHALAAVDLCVREAGGRTGTTQGLAARFNQPLDATYVAATSTVFDAVVASVLSVPR